MKNLKYLFLTGLTAVLFSSCGLFNGGGGGGHCPAYGTSLDKHNIEMNDINNAEELRLKHSEQM